MSFEFDLDQALKDYPLPEKYQDVVMNKAQLADALGTTTQTLDKWMGKGIPVLDAGTNGKSYKFQLSHCWSWRAAKTAFKENEKSIADEVSRQMALDFMNLHATEKSTAGMTADDLEEIERRERLFNLLEEGRISRVLRQDVVEVMGLTFTIIREYLQTQPDVLERDVGLEPHQTTAVVRSNDELMIQLKNRLEQSPIFAEISATLPVEDGDPIQVH